MRTASAFSNATRTKVDIVRLDTVQMRKVAENGKFFQITSVPTLVLVYGDGNLQLFLGAPKIVEWFNLMSRPQRPPEPQNMYGSISASHPLGSRTQQRPDNPELYEPVQREEYYEEEPEQIEIVDDYQEPVQKQKSVIIEDDYEEEAPAKEKPVRKSKSKKSKPKVEEDDSVSEKRRIAKEKLNKAASAKGKPLSSRMKDVYNMAKQMEEDRTGSLGYKEEDLPRY